MLQDREGRTGKCHRHNTPGCFPIRPAGPWQWLCQLLLSLSSSRPPLLAALQGSSPWPRQGLGRPGGFRPPWQLAFAPLTTNMMKAPSRSKRAAVVCRGCFWAVSSSAALFFPPPLSPSKRLCGWGECLEQRLGWLWQVPMLSPDTGPSCPRKDNTRGDQVMKALPNSRGP